MSLLASTTTETEACTDQDVFLEGAGERKIFEAIRATPVLCLVDLLEMLRRSIPVTNWAEEVVRVKLLLFPRDEWVHLQ